MFTVFNFIGSIFGYILWAVFWVVQNFGIAIIVFTLIFRAILFPSSIKQQKSMAKNASLQAKQREIREKYANNKQKANEEIQKLYAKEGVSPTAGCTSSLFPMFIMLGIYYSVVRPLSNVIHLSSDTLKQVNMIPGVCVSENNLYSEIGALRAFSNPDNINLFKGLGFASGDLSKIHSLSKGCNFLGLDMLSIPEVEGFMSVFIIIPALVLITSLGSQILTMRMQGNAMQGQQGCMKYVLYLLPLITVYISYRVPVAVGFYWIWSTIFGFIQSVILNKKFSAGHLNALSEAQHIALMEIKEAKVPYDYQPLPAPKQSTNKKKK